MIISTTDIQNSFGKYLKLTEYEDVIISKNGKKVARLTAFKDGEDDCKFCESSPEYVATHAKVSYEEFLRITKESERRYELINGDLYFLASQFYPHQKAVKEIFGEFIDWFRNKKCEPLTAPFDVTLVKSEKNICVVQPDILIICDGEKMDKRGKYTGVPSLVVEVLSEATSSKDNVVKLELYMNTGVQEYWLVNTESKEIYLYVFGDKTIRHVYSFKGNERAESSCFPGLGVDLQKVFT
ncbi:MAG: type II toxin-antitoxin system Phd/YefM family antitoxin [Clostridiaceae bacterium]|jgi:prevent-host-death family protein|nr:type II toxin-antitoxin system Phd/YefM family antitoxin [Clostridiaceae bacterium]